MWCLPVTIKYLPFPLKALSAIGTLISSFVVIAIRFVCKVVSDFRNFNVDDPSHCVCACVRACVRACLCVSVCLSLASDSSEAITVIIIKLGKMMASDKLKHHMLIILTWTFTQGHTDLNHENNKCSIISETVQAVTFTFAVKILWLEIYIIFFQSDDLALHSRSQLLRLKLDQSLFSLYYNNIQYLEQYSSYDIQTWHDGRFTHGIVFAHAKQAISIKLATTPGLLVGSVSV